MSLSNLADDIIAMAQIAPRQLSSISILYILVGSRNITSNEEKLSLYPDLRSFWGKYKEYQNKSINPIYQDCMGPDKHFADAIHSLIRYLIKKKMITRCHGVYPGLSVK